MKYSILCIMGILFILSTGLAGDWEVFVNSNRVSTLWLDTTGVWWGSQGGVVSYDPEAKGSQDSIVKIVKSVGGLRSNRIGVVAIDTAGAIWIGTAHDGVCINDHGTWRYENTRNLHLLSDDVLDMARLGGKTAVGTSGGLSLFEGTEFIRFFNGNDWAHSGCDSVLAVAINDQEALVGTVCGLFAYLFTEGTWRELVPGKRAYRIAYNNQGVFWIVAGDSIYTYDGTAMQVASKKFIDGEIINDIGAAGSDVWVVSNRGPSKYDLRKQSWDHNRNGIPEDLRDVQRVRIGEGGAAWIGTKDGAGFLRDTTWVIVRSPGPAGNYVEDLCIDGTGMVWFTTGYRKAGPPLETNIGILRYDPSRLVWDRLTAPTQVPSNVSFPCETNPVDGAVWLGFWEGTGNLLRYDPSDSTWTSYADSLKRRVISDIYIDHEGNVAFAEYQWGVGVRSRDGKFIHYSKDDIGTCIMSICPTAIGPGPGGTYMIGNYYVSGEGCASEVVRLGLGEDFSSKSDDLCQRWIGVDGWPQGIATYTFALDSYGIVWLGSGGGLGAYDFKSPKWTRTNTRLGSVWDIKVDRDNNKWVGCDDGLYVLKGPGMDWDRFAEIEFFNSANSPLEAAPVKAIDFDADGALWIGTAGGGIYRYTPTRAQPEPRAWIDVYPNPCCMPEPCAHSQQDCSKGIGFLGFLPNSTIKIFTIAGDFVAEVDPLTRWDTRNASGREAASGAYIYVGRAEDGSDFKGTFVIVR